MEIKEKIESLISDIEHMIDDMYLKRSAINEMDEAILHLGKKLATRTSIFATGIMTIMKEGKMELSWDAVEEDLARLKSETDELRKKICFTH